MCRDDKIYDTELAKRYKEKIDSILPMLSNTEYVYLNGAGELFASDLCKPLVKKDISSKRPNMTDRFFTLNLLLGSE